MRKVVDLTLPIVSNHWRYSNTYAPVRRIVDGEASNATRYELQSHMFTHIDAPRHILADGKVLEEFPLDLLVGKAAILDVSDVAPNQGIDADMLRKAYERCEPSSILLVKTSWGLQRDWMTTEFWDDAPYITDSGAEYLMSLNPKVVGYDFPQDYDLRRLRHVPEHECDLTTHRYILINEVLMIEYMTNLWQVPKRNVDFVGLPLYVTNADGAQIRCVAVFDE